MKRLIFILFMLLAGSPAFGQEVQKEITKLGGKARAYYLFVPDKLTKDRPAPLLLLLHGSGRNGVSLVDKWKDLAKKEGIILVGPDAINSRGWNVPADGPDFLHELISELKDEVSNRCPPDVSVRPLGRRRFRALHGFV